MDFKSILLAQKTGYIPRNHFDALFAKRTGGAVLKDFPGLPSSIVTVTDALAKPLDSLKVAITPVQEGSGDPSPDNIRPISGWTECNVTRCGKNLFDKDVDISANKYYYNSSGVAVPSKNYRTSEPIAIKPNTSYFWAINGVPPRPGSVHQAPRVVFLDDSGAFISSGNELGNSGSASTSPNNARYMMVPVYTSSPLSVDIAMLTEGDTIPTTYEPYQGTSIPITFPSEAGTVYGGTLDVVNGVLTVTDVIKTLSGDASEEWSALSVEGTFLLGNCFVGAPSNMKTSTDSPVCLCNMYKESNSISNSSSIEYKENNVFCNQGRGEYYKRLFIKDTRFTDVNDFTQMLSSYNLKIVYPLATPITYQLTPTEVQMLLGTNNIWADTGDILEGKYWGKKSSATRAMINTLRDTGEITEVTPEEPEELEEPEENADER